LKYSNRGGKIQLSTFARDGNVCISVKDQGIGFSEHDKDHLFDRFYRATSAEVQKRKGSGIGLSIVAATTKAMNGSLEAHSEGLGMGSEFIARFPSI
jgi:signal transduction histidine kinase